MNVSDIYVTKNQLISIVHLNATVKFILSESGKRLNDLRSDYYKLKVGPDGFVETELWKFMFTFGSLMHEGGDPPCEGGIIFIGQQHGNMNVITVQDMLCGGEINGTEFRKQESIHATGERTESGSEET